MATDVKQPTGANPILPEGYKLWRVDGNVYVVYDVPTKSGPRPIMFHVERPERLDEIMQGQEFTPDKELTAQQAAALGAVPFGVSTEIDPVGGHPWDAFMAQVERNAEIMPWLADAEVVASLGAAWLRGEDDQNAIKRTEWWQSRNDTERQWALLAASNPGEARFRQDEARTKMREAVAGLGVNNAPDAVLNMLADNVLMGRWTGAYAAQQARKLSDPFVQGDIDPELAKLVSGVRLDTTRTREDKVSQLVQEWLGPAHGWQPDETARWAGRLRNDPDAEQELVDTLKLQKQARFGNYDINLPYVSIAAGWRAKASQYTGGPVDETKGWFQKLVQMNDPAQADQFLREQGMEEGWEPVLQETLKGMAGPLGEPGVRRAA